MHLRTLLFALPVLLAVGGCSDDPPAERSSTPVTTEPPEPTTPSKSLDTNVRLTQLVDGFDTLEACQAAANGVNCLRELTLCKNTGFSIMVTDIVNEGRYTQDGNTVRATVKGGGDVHDFELVLQGDSIESADLGGEHPWQKLAPSATEAQRIDEDCEVLPNRLWWNESAQ